jgi:hypothetical protein
MKERIAETDTADPCVNGGFDKLGALQRHDATRSAEEGDVRGPTILVSARIDTANLGIVGWSSNTGNDVKRKADPLSDTIEHLNELELHFAPRAGSVWAIELVRLEVLDLSPFDGVQTFCSLPHFGQMKTFGRRA